MKILVTSGGTREAIDAVRFIGNVSTGKTGAAIADACRSQEHEVTYLHGIGAKIPTQFGENIEYSSYDHLRSTLRVLLQARRYDAVIHLAAVSDYSIDSIQTDGQNVALSTDMKMKSDAQKVTLNLKRNPKLLQSLKEWSANKNTQIVGFKLTNNLSDIDRLQAVQGVFDGGGVDWVVHNDLTEISDDQHIATLYGPMGPMTRVNSKQELARKICGICDGGKS